MGKSNHDKLGVPVSTPRSLNEEEKKFLQENVQLALETLKIFEDLCFCLGLTFGKETSRNEARYGKNLAKVLEVSLVYFTPLLYQYYDSIIDALYGGNKISATVLLRAQLEVFIDLVSLFNSPELIQRYLDFCDISTKWYIDSKRVLHGMPINFQEAILSQYNDFKKKYNIQNDNELSTWSGISVRKMTLQNLGDLGKVIYSAYTRCSSYCHPSSQAGNVIMAAITQREVIGKVLHETLDNAFFFGGYVLFLTLDILCKLIPLENDDNAKKLIEKKDSILAKFNALGEKTGEWKDTVRSFYGKGEVAF